MTEAYDGDLVTIINADSWVTVVTKFQQPYTLRPNFVKPGRACAEFQSLKLKGQTCLKTNELVTPMNLSTSESYLPNKR